MDVYDGGDPASQKDLVTREFTGDVSQQFRIVSEGDGHHSIRPVGNENLRVDVYEARDGNGTKLWLYENNGTDAQRFNFVDAGNNRLAIYTKLDVTKAIEVQNGWAVDNQPVQIWQRYADNMGMHWYLEKASAPGIQDGEEYYIKNVFTGRYLDVQGGAISQAGTNVGNYDYNGASNQKWKVRRNNDGTYNLITSYDSEFTLMASGSNIAIWYTGYGDEEECFTLERDNTLAYGGTYYITCKSVHEHIAGGTPEDKYVGVVGNNVAIRDQPDTASLWSFERVEKGNADIISCSYPINVIHDFQGDYANSTHISVLNNCGYQAHAYNNSVNKSTALQYLKSDDIYVHSQHGDQGVLFYRIDENNTTYMHTSDIRSLNNNALSNLRCFISLGCSTGYGDFSTNIVQAVYNKGASFSLGWNNVTHCPAIHMWYEDFLGNIEDKQNIATALQNTDYEYWFNTISDGQRYYLGDANQFLYH